MAVVLPFRALTYNHEQFPDLAPLVAPPYDIIDSSMGDVLRRRSEFNAVHLELPSAACVDGRKLSPHENAARLLREWQERAVLVREPSPCLYRYVQGFDDHGAWREREGIICRVRLEAYETGIILRHERTLSGPKQDRIAMLEHCRVNLSPVLALYSDPEDTAQSALRVASEDPLWQFTDDQGVEHTVWRITDQDAQRTVSAGMTDRWLLIADGHHRYESALEHCRRVTGSLDRSPRDHAADYVMMVLVNGDSPGLAVWPYHRFVHADARLSPEKLQQELARFFDIIDCPIKELPAFAAYVAEQHRGADRPCFGLAPGSGVHWLVTLRPEGARWLADHGMHPLYAQLDVAVLHRLLLEEILGIDADMVAAGAHVRYTVSTEVLSRWQDEDPAGIACVLAATSMHQTHDLSAAGLVMPQKSTYFYPKLSTGLAFNPLYD